MKLIVQAEERHIGGFIRSGHVAMEIKTAPIAVQATDTRAKMMKRLTELVRPGHLGPIDRVLTPSQFADMTGMTLDMGGETSKPSRKPRKA